MILFAPPPALLQTPPAAVTAATQTVPTPVLTDPEWLKRPTRASIQAALPAAAKADGVGGQAGFGCEIEPDARLTKCYPGDPANGYGFNAAAAALAPTFRIRPGKSDGRPIEGGRVYIPIRFEPPPGPARVRPIWTAGPTSAEVAAALPVSHGVRHAGGVGVMRCTVSGGALTDCRPAADPPDALGAAAVKLAQRFVIGDAFGNGRSTQAVIFDIPVVFEDGKAPAVTLGDAPTWVRRPSAEQIAATAPVAAKERGVSHMEADEACIVQTDGGLGSCRLTREEPVGIGVAQAAAWLVNAYQTVAWLPEGRPSAGAPVRLTLKWDVSAQPVPSASPARRR